ncbi:hypothetical protein ACFQJD_12095 [Haloplanus sp. GCM10025708]|uniref:hypothetical protein n=1 Tax=Haloferacaceae TaxID=1644056 RepID=UPI00360C405E
MTLRRSTADESSGRLGGWFSVRAFLLVLVASLVALVVGGSIPVVGLVGRFVGLFVVAFAAGLLADGRRYVEAGVAGGLASGLGFVLSSLATPLFPVVAQYGVEIAGVGATTGALVSLAGHYFGRDLRDGLTRDLS